MQYLSFGVELVSSLLVPILLGRWADVYWEHEFPVGTLIGAFIGCVMVIYLMIRMYKRQTK